jgi:hypothetical protein
MPARAEITRRARASSPRPACGTKPVLMVDLIQVSCQRGTPPHSELNGITGGRHCQKTQAGRGAVGSAWAHALGCGTGLIVMVGILGGKRSRIWIRVRRLRSSLRLMKRVASIALAGTVQMTLCSSSRVAVRGLMGREGHGFDHKGWRMGAPGGDGLRSPGALGLEWGEDGGLRAAGRPVIEGRRFFLALFAEGIVFCPTLARGWDRSGV